MSLKSTLEGLRKVIAGAHDIIRGAVSGGLADAAKKAQDLSGVIQESIGPSLKKASEELPKNVQALSSTIEKATDDVKRAMISHWERVKKEAEERRK